jgi:hypothetical protein
MWTFNWLLFGCFEQLSTTTEPDVHQNYTMHENYSFSTSTRTGIVHADDKFLFFRTTVIFRFVVIDIKVSDGMSF